MVCLSVFTKFPGHGSFFSWSMIAIPWSHEHICYPWSSHAPRHLLINGGSNTLSFGIGSELLAFCRDTLKKSCKEIPAAIKRSFNMFNFCWKEELKIDGPWYQLHCKSRHAVKLNERLGMLVDTAELLLPALLICFSHQWYRMRVVLSFN